MKVLFGGLCILGVVIVTEKPSVARDIAAVLKLNRRGRHAIEGEGYTVTWALGHLVTLAEPHQMNPLWKQWRREDLPLLPGQWPLEILEKTAEQFEAVRSLINAPTTEAVICATDAGREGELIFRYIYEKAACQKPCQRLWISSLTPEAIRDGLARMRPLADFDGLADSARARSRADWLVGMNLSRAYSLSTGQNFSIGRVQTPTLAMLVERELEIQEFVPQDYVTIEAQFSQDKSAVYRASLCDAGEQKRAGLSTKAKQPKRFEPDDPRVQVICARAAQAVHHVHSLEEKPARIPAPGFYDLTELQRHANRLWGWSAQRTLDLAQDLYEKHKVLTYPRTDSRHVPKAMVPALCEMAKRLLVRYQDQLTTIPTLQQLSGRFADDAQVSDHHAIVPTGQSLEGQGLGPDHAKIFDMVCRRLLTAFMDDFVTMNSEVVVRSEPQSLPSDGVTSCDFFAAKGRRIVAIGWKQLDYGRDKDGDAGRDLPSQLAMGQAQTLQAIKPEKRKTVAPPRLTDASLLTAMEHAGSKVKDKQLAAAMREHGLGTPATRSSIIETLIHRQYIVRDKRSLQATDKALRLIGAVDEEIKSPKLTGAWEYRLLQIQQGKADLQAFEADIRSLVTKMTKLGLSAAGSFQGASLPAGSRTDRPTAASERSGSSCAADHRGEELAPRGSGEVQTRSPSNELSGLLQKYFGFMTFRPHQEAVCRDLVEGRDVLLVMPTGAGKSLCYQLPGLAMGRPTLVISPLIALMDDQVARLRSMGLRAGAIHSGNSRSESQEFCRLYAVGQLDFLFIAPERLGVAGFVNFLSQHKPGLIAIDEAHCISNWGHDFRYDYRRLTERLAPLRPAVMVAMTATATQMVQGDIVEQLSLQQPVLHVHGFRRTNIAIEHLEISKRERSPALIELLSDATARPAIVYAPTRREAEQAAQDLGQSFHCAAYHAGMDSQRRSDVQTAFQADRLEVIVATIAFGMGIDKPNVRTVVHLAIPSSLEGYYQEIGRAGRDGKPSRAVLFSSYADIKTHEYFLNRNYPDIKDLRAVLLHIPEAGRSRFDFQNDDVEASIERLLMIGALTLDPGGLLTRSPAKEWERAYSEQKLHRQKQLHETMRFVGDSSRCRMLQLLDHFGDKDAQGAACGLCDVCAPENRMPIRERSLTAVELESVKKLWEYLEIEGQAIALGRLFRDCGELLGLDRRSFEHLIDRLVRSKDLTIQHASFKKNNERIEYRTVQLARSKPSIAWDDMRVAGSSGASTKPRPPRKGASRNPEKKPVEKVAKRVGASAAEGGILERLKSWRKTVAQQRKIPAYCILSDRCLEEIAHEMPRDQDQLLTISGIGPVKCEQFGESLLGLLRP